ncbi:MAG TPA: PAS domain-containing sensor histidine kinase [Bacteriovoracaceae bacterium]|nr:PAS domain-containing sensor histidine kinase [Bacteriovoracaceae bacterium]
MTQAPDPNRTASDRLIDHSQRVLDLFVEAVRRDIFEARKESRPILINSLPLLLKHMQVQLLYQSNEVSAFKIEDAAREHAEQRVQLTDYSLSSVLTEYHILRKILFEVLREEGPLTSTESDIINYVIDRGVAHAGQHYMELSEARLKESQEQFSTLANSISQLAWMADASGYIFWYNDRWYEYTGTTPKQMEGWGWQSVHDPITLPRVLENWKASIETGVPFDMTFPLRSSRGEFRSFLTRVIPVRDNHGKIINWFGTNTDIQAQKETERALSEATENAKLAIRARDEFMSIASHELKTPLTSLKLQLQLRGRNLSKGDFSGFTPEKITKMVEADNRQIDRISRLIDDMLDVSRINTGKLTMEFERFDLCSLAEEVLSRYRDQFDSLGLKVSLVCCDPVEGYWDRFRIEQAIANLLMNAMKYGGGNPVEISVGLKSGRAILMVRDQGIGIAKENMERIFKRFERAVAPSEISGLGLGLYITKQILELHGGGIRVESESGKGSTFIIELPISS